MKTRESELTEKIRVIIYSRPGCHLCEEARQAIESAGGPQEYTLEQINIESSPELLRLYRFDIPVITMNGVEIARHRITASEFNQKLERVLRRRAKVDSSS